MPERPSARFCRKMGVAEATFYRWRKVYAGMGVSEIRRLKQLEDENGKLKRLVADLTLDKTMLQDDGPSIQWTPLLSL